MLQKNISSLGVFFVSAYALAAGAGNIGHKIGTGNGDPENSMSALKAALGEKDGLSALQNSKSYIYMEYDVHENVEGDLYLLHDDTLNRTVPNSDFNKA